MKQVIKNGIMSIFFVFVLSSLFATTFEEVDFEKLILNHPMMKNYDYKTGHFNNTAYELQDVEKLKKDVRDLENKAKKLKETGEKLTKQILEKVENNDNEDEEEKFWDGVVDRNRQSKDIEENITPKKELIEKDGDTGYTHLYKIIDDMTQDVLLPLYKKGTVVFNKFPKNYYLKNRINGYFDSRNLLKENNLDFVKSYIIQTHPYGAIFPNTDKTILYKESDIKEDEVGTIDLTLAMLLHPKMAFFNYINIGFNKYELGLTRNECDKEYEKYKKEAINKDKVLKELNLKLDGLFKKEIEYYNKNRKNSFSKEFINKMKSIENEQEKVKKEIFDNLYYSLNPEVTSPSESIKIMETVNNDIKEVLKEICKEKGIKIIFNSNIPFSFEQEYRYNITNVKNLGPAGINFSVFYSFFHDHYLDNPNLFMGNDYYSKKWFSLVSNGKDDLYKLSLKPYPMILSGGNSLLKELVKKYYKKYNIPEVAYTVFESVIEKVEANQNGKEH